MKKSLLAALLAAALVLQACGKPRSKALQISLFTEIDVLTIMKEHLKEFERKEGIQVEPVYIPYGNYNEKLVAQLSAGQAPDVVWIDVTLFPDLNHHGVFRPLNSFLEKDTLKLKDYYPDVVRRFTKEGKVYAIPQDTAPIACLYYDKAAFKEAGIKVPKGDWSWAEFLSASKKLVKKNAKGEVQRWAFMDNYGPEWAAMIHSNGGKLVDNVENPTRCLMDQPEAVEAIQFLNDLMNKHHVSPLVTAKNNILGYGQDEFVTGRVAMFRTGIWVVPTLKKAKGIDWDILPFPSGPRAKRGKGGWTTGGSGYAISRDCRKPEDAWRLVKFLSSKASQEAYAKTGFVQPGLMALAKSDAFLKSAPPSNKGFLHEAVSRSVYPPAHPRWREIELSVIANDMNEYFRTGGDAKPVLEGITKKVNEKLFSK